MLDSAKLYTEQLLNHLEICRERFLKGEKPKKEREFFNQVKLEADPVFQLLDKWENAALIAIQQKTKTIHPQQISSTKENMQTLLLHSYYKDTRKRRFIEMYKSCYYVYMQLLKELT